MAAFDAVLGDRPNQIERQRDDVSVTAADLLALDRTPGEVTEAGIRTNVSVGIRYLASWLNGNGAAAIDNLMEDAATAEISRSQIWQWVRHGRVDERLVREEIDLVDAGDEAKRLFAAVALSEKLADFLTLPAYERLD
jgi:malate synthase